MNRASLSTPPDLMKELARRFKWHGDNIYGSKTLANASPLYAHLSRQVADDPDILALTVGVDLSQQVSNLLFGAVHYLLLNGEQSPLRAHYSDITASPWPAEQAYPHFRAFCLKHAEQIRGLVTTCRVQTNEVQRCTALLPAFQTVHYLANHAPLALLEIGPSLGLNLLWDHYNYDYGKTGQCISPRSSLWLRCDVQGDCPPPIPPTHPTVVWRQGVELLPIDLHNESAICWLRALIWPEHMDRLRLLDEAVAIARNNPPTIVPGDASVILTSVLSQAPRDATLCVYHSYTLNQCSPAIREGIEGQILTYSRTHDFYRVSLEWYSGQARPQLELFSYRDGEVQHELLALCESHGRAIEWLDCTGQTKTSLEPA